MLDPLTLNTGEFYGWTMYPGYGDGPCLSPVEVLDLRPIGGRTFELRFLNVFYAAGVQEMAYTLRTLRRERSYIVAEEWTDFAPTDRTIVMERLTPNWWKRAVPNGHMSAETIFDPGGAPRRDAIYRLLA